MRSDAASALAVGTMLLGIALGVGGTLVLKPLFSGGGGQAEQQRPPPVPVGIETIAPQDLPLVYETLGSLRTPHRVELQAAEQGIIRELTIQDGDKVQQGDLILRLDDDREQATLIVAETQRDEAARKLAVAERLTAGKTIAEDAIEELRSALVTAEARVTLAKAQLERRRLLAPFDGTVDLVDAELGAAVGPGTRITTLVQLDPLRITAAVPERFLPYLVGGASLQAILPNGETVDAALVYAAPELDPASRSLLVEAEIPSPRQLLRPGMSLRVRVVLAEQGAVLSVPEEALVFEGNRSYVYVVTALPDLPEGAAGAALPRDLELGNRADGRVVVTGGLQAGERIITSGLQKIFFPGMPVADAAAMAQAQAAGGPPAEATPADDPAAAGE